MKTKTLWLIWLYLFLFCCILGFIPTPPVALQVVLILIGIGFFVPGFFLIYKGGRKTAGWILGISIASLVLTTLSIILNYVSILMSEIWGTVFHIILGILSTPMLCCHYWVISLFGWACLMAGSLFMKK